MTTIRVLIVDDHPVTREGLRAALDLADDIVIAGEADDGEIAIEQAGELQRGSVSSLLRRPESSPVRAVCDKWFRRFPC